MILSALQAVHGVLSSSYNVFFTYFFLSNSQVSFVLPLLNMEDLTVKVLKIAMCHVLCFIATVFVFHLV